MRIKLKYPDVDTFIQKYAVNISRGGIFIATKQPKPIGTYVRFEFLLSDATTSSIIRGEGQVQWTKEFDPAQPSKAHGMGVKFMRLDADSQAVIDRALRWRAEHGTNPGLPMPIPTSSAHTISTPREDSRADRLPYEDSRVDRMPSRDESLPLPVGESTLPESPQMRDEPPSADPEPALPSSGPEPQRAESPPLMAMPDRGETRPIAVDDVEDDKQDGRTPYEYTRPITMPPDNQKARKRPGDDIDALAAEWGLSEEKLARSLKRARPRMAEATAELERLLLKPPKPPTPTKAEAMQQLAALLAKKNGRNGTPTH
ncbi:MAG: conserved region [Myxococcales bacterium]|nr:conserved region [Myxococcales bacterium]